MRIERKARVRNLRVAALVVGALLLLGLVVVARLGLFGLGDCPHPADAELIARFERRRPELEALRRMIVEDRGLLRVTLDASDPELPDTVGVSGARIEAYRTALRSLGLDDVAISADRARVEMTASSAGFVTHGSAKAYVFDPHPDAKRIAADLDPVCRFGFGSGLRRIEGDWYLSFEGT